MISKLQNEETKGKFIKEFGVSGKISYFNFHHMIFSSGLQGISDWLVEDFYLYLDRDDESYITISAINEHLVSYGFCLMVDSPVSSARKRL
jgi:hypothetical protein